MVPIGFILSRTVPLQLFVARVVAGLANVIGIGVQRNGMDLLALDGSFQCQVAGGCSGIRSIMAMTMLSLLYVHFYERAFWKKLVIFGGTILLAVPGNVARVFSIVLVSKWFGQQVGTGPWHDISGFVVTLPIAVGGMLGLSELLNRDWGALKERLLKPEPAAAAPAQAPAEGAAKSEPARSSPISYDY
jgi:exosortase